MNLEFEEGWGESLDGDPAKNTAFSNLNRSFHNPIRQKC